ncbi:MAG: membrane dipeptidase [Woeseiaceae bacterium]|nr:membrane dipeptidase [Woeseiaceae bacterium]
MKGLPLTLLLVAGFTFGAVETGWTQEADEAMQRAMSVLRTSPLIDTHNDLPWVIREKANGDVKEFDLSVRRDLDTDIPRLREGMVGTQFWSVWVPSSLSPLDAMRQQLEQIDLARRMIAAYADDFGFAVSTGDIQREQRRGRIASLIGIEGGHSMGNSLGALRAYYDLGVRYMTLTHFHTIDWADSATDEARHDGITPFGEEVVREMNRLGMMVDISHVSEAAMSDVLRVSEAPVIFSHSSARTLTKHMRNVPDNILKQMPENGGVVMVAFIPPFVSEPARIWADDLFPLLKQAQSDDQWQHITRQYETERGASPRAKLTDVANHIDYIAKVAGVDHVGIGADFYGAEIESELVQGLEDVSKYPLLFAELVRRGWSDEDLRKLARENLLRAFAEVEQLASRLRRSRSPSLATIEELDNQP